MEKMTMKEKLKGLPLPILPTTLGAITLSNVYGLLGFSFVKNFFNLFGTIIILYYLAKIVSHPRIVKKEYSQTVPASLYAALSMILMLLAVYYAAWIPGLRYLFYGVVVLHALHIVLFSYKHVFKNFNDHDFLPTWFVTYNGIMVSTVAGSELLGPLVADIIFWYGLVVYLLLIPFIIKKIYRKGIKEGAIHSTCIILAPCSLIVASYVIRPDATLPLGGLFYLFLLLSLLLVITRIPVYFAPSFSPGMAALTFPMAIGTLASFRMSGFLANRDLRGYAELVKQVGGAQLFLTTSFIAYVLFNFYKILIKSHKISP